MDSLITLGPRRPRDSSCPLEPHCAALRENIAAGCWQMARRGAGTSPAAPERSHTSGGVRRCARTSRHVGVTMVLPANTLFSWPPLKSNDVPFPTVRNKTQLHCALECMFWSWHVRSLEFKIQKITSTQSFCWEVTPSATNLRTTNLNFEGESSYRTSGTNSDRNQTNIFRLVRKYRTQGMQGYAIRHDTCIISEFHCLNHATEAAIR